MTDSTTPRRGELTRDRIVASSAPLFNQRGFAGASMSQIMVATGLEKGGIYRHFASKDDLALAAFDYAVERSAARIARAADAPGTAVDRLLALVAIFERLATDPPVPGGCPLLNTAVESDDAHPTLRARTREAMDRLRAFVRRLVRAGVEAGELRADVEPEAIATILVATLEGALMLTRLYDDPAHSRRVSAHLSAVVRALAAEPAAGGHP